LGCRLHYVNKLVWCCVEVTAQLESAQSKAAGADKARKRLQAEVEELTAELDKVISDRGGFRHDMFVYSEVDKTQLGIVNVLYHEPRFLKKNVYDVFNIFICGENAILRTLFLFRT